MGTLPRVTLLLLLGAQLPAPVAAPEVLKTVVRREGVDVEGAVFTGKDLRGARFTSVRAPNAVLEGVDLRASQFMHVDLRRANLQRTRGNGAVWMAVDLRSADLRDAQWEGLVCLGCRWDGARINAGSVLPRDLPVDIRMRLLQVNP